MSIFPKTAPRSKHQRKMKLSFFVHGSAPNRRQTTWRKLDELENFNGIVETKDLHYGF